MKLIHYNKKKIKNVVLFIVGLFTAFFGMYKTIAGGYSNMSAEAPATGVVDQVTVNAYKCSKSAIEELAGETINDDLTIADYCAQILSQSLMDMSTYKLSDGASIDPGSVILVELYYDYLGSTGESIISGANFRVGFNTDQMSYVDNGSGKPYYYVEPPTGQSQYSETPAFYKYTSTSSGLGNNKKYTHTSSFSVSGDWDSDQNRLLSQIDYTTGEPSTFKNSQPLVYYALKLKSDATAGATLPIDLGVQQANSDASYAANSTGNVSKTDGKVPGRVYLTANSLSLKVAGGSTSTDNTMLSLVTSSNGQTYAFDTDTPFTPGSKTVTTYLTRVPNSVADIDITAVANDTGGSVAGAFGDTPLTDTDSTGRTLVSEDNGLQEGMNTFTITVTSPNGDAQLYTVNVYRLSNDASIDSITTSGITLTKASDTKYTGNTTYDDIDTMVDVQAHNQNATVVSDDLGLWTFTSSGTTPNTHTVTVQAENCKYPSVTNNSCTSVVYTIEIMRTAPSSTATLSDLTVNGTTVTGFTPSSKTYNYGDVANNVTSLTIGATLSDSTGTIVSGTGTCNLTVVGDNACVVKTLAQDGVTEDEYTINVHRLSNETKLYSLTFTSDPNGTLSPSFQSSYTTGEYTYTYDPSVSTIKVNASVMDVGKAEIAIVNANSGVPSTYTSTANSAEADFAVPSTKKAAILVTAEDGTVHTYEIVFTRQTSTNNYLNSLTMKYNNGTEDVNVPLTNSNDNTTVFKAADRNYTATVPASIDTVTLTAEKAVQYSKVTKIGDTVATIATPDLTTGTKGSLTFGENTVQVTVVNEAGNDNTYTITLTREKYDIKTLDALNLGSGFTTTFAPGTNDTTTESYTYDGNVPFATTQLSLTGTKTNSYATVTAKLTDEKNVDHEITLTDGTGNTFSSTVDIPTGTNTITVTVKAHDNTTKNYTIAVTRTKNNNTDVSGVRISTGSGPDDYVDATVDVTNDAVYHATVPYQITSVQPAEIAIGVSSDAQVIKGTAVTDLKTDESKQFTFTVKAEDGTEKDYTVNIIRAQNAEALITKVTLTLTGEGISVGTTASCTIASTESGCTIGVPTSTTGFVDTLEYSDGATIDPVTGTSHSMPSTDSTKTLTYTITSENTQNNKTYVITVERTLSSVNTLSDLAVEDSTVSGFTPSNNVYTNTQAGTVETVEVKATVTETGKAKVSKATVNGTEVTVTGTLAEGVYTFDAPLNFGNNAVVITVEAENTQTQNYNLTITRQQRNNPKLTYIKYKTDPDAESYTDIVGYTAATGSYTLPTVDYEVTSIAFIADPEDEFGTAIITSVTDEDGNVTATDVADTDSTDDNTYTASVNLSTGKNIVTITGTAHNGSTTKTYSLTIYRTKNDDNSFSELKVKGVDAIQDPDDTSGKTYTVTLPNSDSSIDTANGDITLTLPAGASVTYNPVTMNLKTTEVNTITMTVTSEGGVGETYTININRTKSADTTLTGATITVASTESGEDGSKLYCYFTGTKECTLNVPTATTGFTLELAGGALTAGTTDPVIPDGGKEYPMGAGSSTVEIPIVVTAENGEDTDNYKITVNRAKSGNNNLSNISYRTDEEETTPWTTVTGFTPSTTLYRVEVPGDIDLIYLKATVQDTGKAEVLTDLSGGKALQFGNNQIEIKVKAENGNETSYYVLVTRKRKTDALLKSIKVDGIFVYPFSSNTFAYTLDDVAYNKTSVEVEAELHDEDPDSEATVTGTGTIDLNTGMNEIVLTVTADDKTTKENYKLYITRAQNDSTAITGITLAGVAATYNSTDGVWEVSVPNDVDKANTGNVVVTPAAGAAERDALATSTLTETALSTKTTTDVTISITAENGTTGTQTLRVTRAKSNLSTLHTLTVEGGSFNPSFVQDSKTPVRYTVTIPETTEKVVINATATDENATIVGLGSFNFAGNATYPVNVTSEDGSDTTAYYLDVVRSTSSVNTLKSITVSSGTTLAGNYTEYTLVSTEDGTTEGFSPETTAYTVTIPGNISKINIDAETSDSRAQIINALSALGEKTIQVGTHTVTIRVQSESGAGQSYVLTIVRLPKPFNLLTDLTVDGDTISGFSPEITSYTLDDVENETASIVIGGTKEDADSSVTGFGTCDLKVGDNVCKVTVTAQNGDKNEYKINVKRKASDENRLSMLTVNGYSLSPAFNADINEYTVTVKATKTTLAPGDVYASAKDSTATIVKDPELTLVTNEYSVYKVTVTSASGKENIYSIRVFKPKSSDATLSSLNLTNASLSGSIQKNVLNYTIYVPHGVASFSIEGIPTVNTTNVISGNDTYTLADTSQVTIITLAEDGTTSLTYTFNVEESLSNDATLSGLMVQGYPFVGTNTTFSPAITTYSIGDIDYSVTGLTILATATNTTSSIKYYVNSVLQTSNVVEIPPGVGSGSITVHVVAGDGLTPKDYTITYNKTYSTNAYLAYMAANVGSFTTNFIKTTYSYVLLVDETVEEVKFTLYTESANAYMSIAGGDVVAGSEAVPYVYTMTGIETGDNPLSILVKPQDSEAEGKNYNVIVRKSEPAANSDATLESLSVDDYPFVSQAGYTSTTFNKEVTDYHIGTVNLKVDKLKVNYSTTQSGATTSILVGGVKVTPDEDGYIDIPTVETNTGVVTVQVIAPNGTTNKNYNIHYNKVASSNAFLASIVVSNGTLSPDFFKETTEYTDTVSEDTMSETITVTPEVLTSTITIGGGAAGITYTTFPAVHSINGLTAGKKEVPITVTSENGTVQYYYVNIFKEGAGELITSETYGHIIENGYITSVSPGVDADTFKGQLDNDNVKLKIFKDDGTGNAGDELGAGELVGTGMIVKLFINGVENDSKVIVIKGDVSGDGEITITDVVKVLNHYLGNLAVTGAYLEAAEVSDDNEITITDVVKILNHYLGNLTLAYHK